MPLYAFECPDCGATLEVLGPSNAPHPDCCGQTMRKLISPVLVRCTAAGSAAEAFADQHKAWMSSDAGKAHIKEREAEGWEMRKMRHVNGE